MSEKRSRQGRQHPRRHSRRLRTATSSRSRRGRSGSRSSRRARSSSTHLRARYRSHSRPPPPPAVNLRDIPIYIPSSENHEHEIPKIIAEALRQQSQEHSEALTATNVSYRPPTPPPDPDAQEGAKPPTPSGLKRRPSSSPAAAKARRRRRRRRRPRQPSVVSDQESPIPPPRPKPPPVPPPRAASPPYSSFFGIIRTRAAEKEKREEDARKKGAREEERRRKKEAEAARRMRDEEADKAGGDQDRKDGSARKRNRLSKASKRTSTAPPLSGVSTQEEQPDNPPDDEPRTESRRGRQHRHKHGGQRRKKHHRRSGEQHHRRQKRRSRYRVRDFFASLRRKLGNLLRFTLPAANPPAPSLPSYADAGYSMPAELSDTPHQGNEGGGEGDHYYYQWQGRTPTGWGAMPYFMHGARSPAESWHSRLSKPRSTRRFTATVESAPGSGSSSPRRQAGEFPRLARTVGGNGSSRLTQHSSGSTIYVFARRFIGPFLSEPSDAATLDGSGAGQRRLSWRSQKLITAGPGSGPVTPPSSRNSSPGDRGRSRSREQRVSIPGAYRSSSSSMGLRSLYTSSPDRRSHSTSPLLPAKKDNKSKYRVSSAEYGLPDLFATPPRVSSPVYSSHASSDYGLQRLFASTPVSSGSNSGLRRIFGE
ncbi:hypothetical protein F5Y10DRAFT_198671 [Nemania abortiva]|nr:hypothetical protein F5Y10DRAFT_198671 [Nemania abortiva]